MAGSESTEIDLVALRDAAKQIEGLMTDGTMAIFETVAEDTGTLEAGKLDAAQWLEAIVADRGAGLHQHALDLQASFEALGERIRTIADLFEQQDQSNADALEGNAVGEIEAWTGAVGEITIPPAEGEATYETGDTANREGAQLGFEVDPMTGQAVKNEEGAVTVTLPGADELNVSAFPDTSITPSVVFADDQNYTYGYEGGFYSEGDDTAVPESGSFTTDIKPEDDEK